MIDYKIKAYQHPNFSLPVSIFPSINANSEELPLLGDTYSYE